MKVVWCAWAGIVFRQTDSLFTSQRHAQNENQNLQLRVGIIGFGNLGGALAARLNCLGLKAAVYDRNIDKIQKAAYDGNVAATSESDLAEKSDVVFIAVKPCDVMEVFEKIKSHMAGKKAISAAAGVSIAAIEGKVGSEVAVIRTMPNICAQAGRAPMFYCLNGKAEKSLEKIQGILSLFGKPIGIGEEKFDSATSAGGSGIAFVLEFLSALEDSMVRLGFSRDSSREIALMLVEGASKMARETGKDFVQLRNLAVSPAGTTVEGLAKMDSAGFRGILSGAFVSAKEKSAAISASFQFDKS